MAFITSIYCHTCKETKTESLGSGQTKMECSSCENLRKAKDEREWKAGKQGLTVEERLAEIEHFIYHHSAHYKGQQLF